MEFDHVVNPLPPVRPRPNRTRLVGVSNRKTDTPVPQKTGNDDDVAMLPTINLDPLTSQRSRPLTSPNGMTGTPVPQKTGNDDDVAMLPTINLDPLTSQRSRPLTPPNGKTDTPVPQKTGNDNDVAMLPTINLDPLTSQRSRPLTSPNGMNGEGTGEPVDDISNQETIHLMQLSGMMRAARVKPSDAPGNGSSDEEGYWPQGIRQTGPFPVVNLYGSEPFGRTSPRTPAVMSAVAEQETKKKPAWRAFLDAPAAKVTIGLLVGIGLLFLVARFVDLPVTIQVLRKHLTTSGGIAFALLSGVAFLTAWSIRGVRWKLFLNPIGKVSTVKAIQLYLVAIFLNFLLPVRGGEVAKSLMLKRVSNIPISKSLPTVAMDKALDLVPALFIMVIVPLLGFHMNIELWLVMAFVSSMLIGLIFFVLLAAWKRDAAIGWLQRMTGRLPKAIASKIEGFATGFVDSLLMGARQPRIFVPAILLTVVAVVFDGLFAMLAFRTIGFPIAFGKAIFGYSVYNMFYILPTPPGQVGSNEFVGWLVFNQLLGVDARQVGAMFLFSHPWSALLMCAAALVCLSALGLTLSSAMKVQKEGE